MTRDKTTILDFNEAAVANSLMRRRDVAMIAQFLHKLCRRPNDESIPIHIIHLAANLLDNPTSFQTLTDFLESLNSTRQL